MLHCFLRALRALAFIDFAQDANIQHATRPKAARTPILRADIYYFVFVKKYAKYKFLFSYFFVVL